MYMHGFNCTIHKEQMFIQRTLYWEYSYSVQKHRSVLRLEIGIIPSCNLIVILGRLGEV